MKKKTDLTPSDKSGKHMSFTEINGFKPKIYFKNGASILSNHSVISALYSNPNA